MRLRTDTRLGEARTCEHCTHPAAVAKTSPARHGLESDGVAGKAAAAVQILITDANQHRKAPGISGAFCYFANSLVYSITELQLGNRMRSLFVGSVIAAASFFSWVYWLMLEMPVHERALTLIGVLYALLMSLVIGAVAWIVMWAFDGVFRIGFRARLADKE